jgi:transposase
VTYLTRRRAAGDTKNEARRALKRRLSNVVYRALLADATQTTHALTPAA